MVRPRDAAGLVLLRQRDGHLQVLLGRRHGKARFMPGVFVTPGGCLDRSDAGASGFPEMLPSPPSADRMLDSDTARRLPVFARCALRETLEETGLLIGPNAPEACTEKRTDGSQAPAWRCYSRSGKRPAFEALHVFARAITPASSPIRFHTRFFLAMTNDIAEAGPGDGELEAVDWISWSALDSLPMPSITRSILDSARAYRNALRHGAQPGLQRIVYRQGRRLTGQTQGPA